MRGIPENNESAFWPGITRTLNGSPRSSPTPSGLKGVSPGRNIQLIPYGTFTGARSSTTAHVRSKADGRAGIDAKVVVQDAVTIDLTANPDFSQVESDEPQVTINQRFEVFFPEKRPFFLENAGYFQTPINLFFSRRIGDPQIGARRPARWAAGRSARWSSTIAHPGRSSTPPTRARRSRRNAVAVRREFGQSSFGALVTSRDFGPSSNRVALPRLPAQAELPDLRRRAGGRQRRHVRSTAQRRTPPSRPP